MKPLVVKLRSDNQEKTQQKFNSVMNGKEEKLGRNPEENCGNS